MKTENTIENKQIFFSLYFKQKVRKMMCLNGDFMDEVYHNYELSNVDEDYLELTSVSKITDEDAIEVKTIFSKYRDSSILKLSKEEIISQGRSLANSFNYSGSCMCGLINVIESADFLRSKSIAIPWRDLTVEDLISYGWVKQKE